MDAGELLAQLAFQTPLPVQAIRAVSADRESAAPIFVNAIEQFVGGDRSAKDSIFFIFHLLGDWREKSAYRPLARLLRCPRDDIDEIFGDGLVETSHRVIAAVFDGDPGPLYEAILDPAVDEFIRSRMLEAIAIVTLRNEMPRAEAARFLRACYEEIDPQDESWVWHGWQSAIALLGLVELKPLVEQAFARGFISEAWLELRHFEQDLRLAVDDPDAIFQHSDGEYSLFGDTITELSSWYCFRPEDIKREKRETIDPGNVLWRAGTAVNRYKNVGRNDPCPCGSGKKFKKCCLTSDVGLTPLEAV